MLARVAPWNRRHRVLALPIEWTTVTFRPKFFNNRYRWRHVLDRNPVNHIKVSSTFFDSFQWFYWEFDTYIFHFHAFHIFTENIVPDIIPFTLHFFCSHTEYVTVSWTVLRNILSVCLAFKKWITRLDRHKALTFYRWILGYLYIISSKLHYVMQCIVRIIKSACKAYKTYKSTM